MHSAGIPERMNVRNALIIPAVALLLSETALFNYLALYTFVSYLATLFLFFIYYIRFLFIFLNSYVFSGSVDVYKRIGHNACVEISFICIPSTSVSYDNFYNILTCPPQSDRVCKKEKNFKGMI